MAEARRIPYLRSWHERWRSVYGDSGGDDFPVIVLQRETGHVAKGWQEAAVVEAGIKGITVEEVLNGKLEPSLEAARARARRERRRDLVRDRNWLLSAVLLLIGAAAFSALAGWWVLVTFYCVLGIVTLQRVPEASWSLPLRIPKA